MTASTTTMTPRKSRIKKYRTTILVLLAAAMVINYLDRSALAVAMPFIANDFNLTPAEKGIIFSSFFLGYALFNFVGGVLADKIGPKKVMAWSMILWSTMCGLVAGAFNFWSLLVLRVLFGVGEGPISTTANKVVNNWFPLKERARSVGINQAGGPLGGALSGPVVGVLAVYFGWRVAFVVIALIGLTWALIWYFVATDTARQNSRVTPAELAEIEAGTRVEQAEDEAVARDAPSMWKAILQPAILATALSLFCYNYILFFFLTWFPSFLVDAQGVSLAGMSVVSALPWVAGTFGYMGGGYLIDYIFRRTGKQFFSRKVVLVTCLLICSVCVGLTGMVASATSAVTLMTVAVGFLMLAAPAYWTLINDAAPKEYVGSAGGLMHGLSNLSGIVAPSITGAIVATSTYTGAFVLAGGFGVVGALVIWAGVRQRQDVRPEVPVA
ncbi:MFS transporter [Saccharopolyspora pogona]|uniref:MFS transporter n=1 Tax=Saccharopolyspora pogona TaxID=333966 RepID=UPI001CC23F45|nr:MFS transporter [Saccharopolyspora pogona]